MKAIILAAGEGQRLRPLTNEKPKCLVELFGKSLIERQIETFHKCGITDIIVITGYKNNKIKIPNVKYYKNKDYASTNMVETLFCAQNELNDDIIISYGDIIYQKDVLEKLIDSSDDCSVVVDKDWKKYWNIRFENPLDDAESLSLKDGFIEDIGQKIDEPESIDGQFIGLMKFQKTGIKLLTEFYLDSKKEATKGKNPLNPHIEFKKSYMTDLLRAFIQNGNKIKSIIIYNGWLELDSVHDYDIYMKFWKENKLKEFIILE